DRIWAAVRVVDLSSLMCVNTAAQNGGTGITMPDATYPVSVDLSSFLGGLYAGLHDERCGETADTNNLSDFWSKSAQKLLGAESPYLPFAISDEMFCRWLGSNGSASSTGRLYEALSTLGNNRRLLTTLSVTRTLVRHPDTNLTARVALTASTALDSNDTKQALYNALIKADVVEQAAAHFVANAWAYISEEDPNTQAFLFTPNAPYSGEPVYGLVPQLVITEAYANHQPESEDGKKDHVWGYAIELMNTTDAAINLSSYKLLGVTGEPTLPDYSLDPGAKAVLYDWGKGAGASVAVDQTAVGFPASLSLPVPLPANWKQVSGLDFSGGNTITLVRVVGSENVPIDQVGAGDIGYSCSDKQIDIAETKDIRRDDDSNRCRYNVAAYSDPTNTHALGLANGLTASDLSDVREGFPIKKKAGTGIENLGELLDVYATGPIKGGDAFPQGLKDFKDSISRGRPDIRGEVSASASDYPDVPWATLLSELFEVVPPDTTRTDEPTRIYGRININTATKEVLEKLPFPTEDTFTVKGSDITFDAAVAADYILAYRDKKNISGGPQYETDNRSTASGIANLRAVSDSDIKGFLAAGEVAIPLADYAHKLMEDAGLTLANAQKDQNYLEVRDATYRSISNLIAVNSDIFAANIAIQLRDEDNTIKQTWYYLAVIDRSNCGNADNTPAVLLFCEVK
ncbi:MAG: lamin tail domain-containing protein, partial [Phycisphaerae bacterium]|nr:lamin tail domain-containing protein [Phycisphaerae bacterium]